MLHLYLDMLYFQISKFVSYQPWSALVSSKVPWLLQISKTIGSPSLELVPGVKSSRVMM